MIISQRCRINYYPPKVCNIVSWEMLVWKTNFLPGKAYLQGLTLNFGRVCRLFPKECLVHPPWEPALTHWRIMDQLFEGKHPFNN